MEGRLVLFPAGTPPGRHTKAGEAEATAGNKRVIVNNKNPALAHTGDRRIRVHIAKLDSLLFGILSLHVATVPLLPFR